MALAKGHVSVVCQHFQIIRFFDCLESSFVAFGELVLTSFINNDPRLTMTYLINGNVNLSPLGLSMEKVEKVLFSVAVILFDMKMH